MATLSVNVPDAYVQTIAAAIDHLYGSETSGLSNANKGRYAIKQHFKALVQRHQQLTATSAERAAADSALVSAQEAETAAKQALATAIADALAQVETDFENIS